MKQLFAFLLACMVLLGACASPAVSENQASSSSSTPASSQAEKNDLESSQASSLETSSSDTASEDTISFSSDPAGLLEDDTGDSSESLPPSEAESSPSADNAEGTDIVPSMDSASASTADTAFEEAAITEDTSTAEETDPAASSTISTDNFDPVEETSSTLSDAVGTKGKNWWEDDEDEPAKKAVKKSDSSEADDKDTSSAPPKAQKIVISSDKTTSDGTEIPYSLTSKYFLGSVEEEFIEILNEARAEKGLSPLTLDPTLAQAARLRAVELVKTNTFAHERPDGRSWSTVLEEEFPVSYRIKGENLALAYYRGEEQLHHKTAQEWYEQWLDSPSHRELMFRSDFETIGVGIYYKFKNSNYTSVAACLFGGN